MRNLEVGIEIPNQAHKTLYVFNQDWNLQKNIDDFCSRMKVPAGQYALKNLDTKECLYITEANRSKMKDGNMLRLVIAPQKVATDIIKSLKSDQGNTKRDLAIQELIKESSDPTFADIFIEKNGLNFLVSQVESRKLPQKDVGFMLKAVLELSYHYPHDLSSVLTDGFIRYVCQQTDNKSNSSQITLQCALGILELALVNSDHLYTIISDVIVVGTVMTHIQNTEMEVQVSTMALINSLFMKAPSNRAKLSGRRQISDAMTQKQFRNLIMNNVIRGSNRVSDEMAHQLYVLQVLLLNLLADGKEIKQAEASKDLEDFCSLAAEPLNQDHKKGRALTAVERDKLGFTNLADPIQDFKPSGHLGLSFMLYFARTQQDNFNKLVLENNSRETKHNCPFVKSAIYVTNAICDVLRIGEAPDEAGQRFFPLLFAHDHAVEELFCICIILFNKTWKEMNAIREDFDKVLGVVCDQIKWSLKLNPQNMDTFRQKLPGYNAILKKREQQLVDQDDIYLKAKPVIELRDRLLPSITHLIRQQRLNYLKHGSVFHKLSSKRRDKTSWFCRLSADGKYLQYGDIEDNIEPSQTTVLPNTLAVANIKEMVTGKNNQHLKNARSNQKAPHHLIFSLSYDPDEVLHFVAPTELVWDMWTDGINTLMGRTFNSRQSQLDVDRITNLEVKLQLLELENIPIPDSPPQLPPLPSDYDFALAAF